MASIQNTYKSEVLKGLNRFKPIGIVTENDILPLPDIVQKYLRYVGVIGKEKVHNLRIRSAIEIDMEARGRSVMQNEEYNFFDRAPTRVALMKFKMSGIPVTGLDAYIDGKGTMQIKPLGLFTVVNATGREMDSSEAVVLLANMCIGAPATLIDNRFGWEIIDPLTVKTTFTDNHCAVSAVLEFSDEGQLVRFSTEDKYYAPSGKDFKKVPWSTPVRNYREINGLMLATYGEAIWHFPEGDFCYGRVTTQEIEFNCQESP